MKIICTITGMLVFFAAASLTAQQVGTITGLATDVSGQPVVGVQVYISALDQGAIAQTNGRYLLQNIPTGVHTVTAQRIGYRTVSGEVTVTEGQVTSFDFQLLIQPLMMQEIVATGLIDPVSGVLSPISVDRVNMADLGGTAAGSVLQNLQGRVAGLRITRQTGTPGAEVVYHLRTPTSVIAEGQPLIVIDGVIQAQGLGTSNIESADVESIEVIKGAAAASLYGSRANGGVIAITTVRGQGLALGETRISVTQETGRAQAIRSDPFPTHHQFLMDPTGSTYVDLLGNPVGSVDRVEPAATNAFMRNTYPGPIFDNQSTLFSGGNFSTTNVSLQRNAESTNFAIGLSRYNEAGPLTNNDGYERYSFRVNLDHRVSQNLNVGVTGYYSQDWLDAVRFNFRNLIFAPPDVDLSKTDEDGNFVRIPDADVAYENPLWTQASREEERRRARSQGSLSLDWEPVYWLSFAGNVSYDRQNQNTDQFIPKGTPLSVTANRPSDGELIFEEEVRQALNAEAQVSVRRDFGLLNARTTFRTLIERDQFDFREASGTDFLVGGVRNLSAAGNRNSASLEEEIRATGYLWDTAFNYDDKFIATGLFRYDGSSLFGEDERWQPYYRAAGAYRLGQEDWFDIPNVSELKLSYARGTAGGRPQFAHQYETWDVRATGVSKSTIGNSLLKPEHTLEQEMSVETILFDRLGVDVTYSWQRTRDQLVDIPLPALTGFETQWANVGTVVGNTIEVTFDANLVQTPDFSWTSTLVFDRSRAKIEDWPIACRTPGFRNWCTGNDLLELWQQDHIRQRSRLGEKGHQNVVDAGQEDEFETNDDGWLVWVGPDAHYTDGIADGLWGTETTIGRRLYRWGLPLWNRNEDGSLNKIQTGDGNSYQVGWMNTFSFGDFQIHGQLHASTGGETVSFTERGSARLRNRGLEMDQFGKPDELLKPIAYYQQLHGGRGNVSQIEQTDYLKLRLLSVTYVVDSNRLDQIGLGNIPAESLRLSLVGRNLLWMDSCGCGDPEQGQNLGAGRRQSLSSRAYPTSRILSFELGVVF